MGEDKNIIPEETGKIRDDKGHFVKGVSGNPKGRPEGAGISIVTALKRKLEECPEGQTKTYLELLVSRYMKNAIQDGDTQLIRDLINRVDGMPKQSIDQTSNGETLSGLVTYRPEKLNE